MLLIEWKFVRLCVGNVGYVLFVILVSVCFGLSLRNVVVLVFMYVVR